MTFTASYGIVLGNIYGSCAFNLFVIPVADLFHRGPLLRDEHFAALGAAYTAALFWVFNLSAR